MQKRRNRFKPTYSVETTDLINKRNEIDTSQQTVSFSSVLDVLDSTTGKLDSRPSKTQSRRPATGTERDTFSKFEAKRYSNNGHL